MTRGEQRYTQRREQILQRIREGKVSASMSGIEYYDRPWADLDPQEQARLELIDDQR